MDSSATINHTKLVFESPKKIHNRNAAWNLPANLVGQPRSPEPVVFDTSKHLNFQPPNSIFTFNDLGLKNGGISSHALSEPFSLFTKEAVAKMREELFSDQVLQRWYCATSPSSGQIRGHCPRDAPFIYSVWNHPSVLEIISSVAGIELVPAIEYDIGQANISVNSKGEETQCTAPGEEAAGLAAEFCESAFGWHRDSFPFVVVTMLSDCDGMDGGETAIRTGDGSVIKAKGPDLGTAIVMQGMYVEHRANAAQGGRERISMITAFRPKSPFVKDETILRGVRNISNVPTLYAQYAAYRLENLRERVKDQLRLVHEWKECDVPPFDVQQMREWIAEQRRFLDHMAEQFQG